MSSSLFSIGIPTINRADLLNPTLEKYVVDFPDTTIYIIDNGDQAIFEHPNIVTEHTYYNLGVACSWNRLCNLIFYEQKSLYAWIINDDIYMGMSRSSMSLMMEDPYGEYRQAALLSAPGSWCNFLLPRSTFESVGCFDEAFYPAYYEDNDYAYRMSQMGLQRREIDQLFPVEIRVSQSREKDPSLNAGIEQNEQYYRKKWGGPPGEEHFRTPFDK